jgi:predicted RNA binding protein YcfA (HicA-like mRNA interferase family)
MKMPGDISGDDLAQRLSFFGYEVTRQVGSHLRLTTVQGGQHHITIPRHNPLRIGTLSGILADIAEHLNLSKPEVVRQLFGK